MTRPDAGERYGHSYRTYRISEPLVVKTIPLSSSQPSYILALITSGYEILYILYE
jgi:hypothetical protein